MAVSAGFAWWWWSSPLSRRLSSRGSSWVEHQLVGGSRRASSSTPQSTFGWGVCLRVGLPSGGGRNGGVGCGSSGTLLGPEGVAVGCCLVGTPRSMNRLGLLCAALPSGGGVRGGWGQASGCRGGPLVS